MAGFNFVLTDIAMHWTSNFAAPR